MLNSILIAVLLLYVIFVEALGGNLSIRKLKKTAVTESIRIKSYKSTIVNGWVNVTFVLGIIIFTEITAADVGLKMININFKYFNTWVSILILSASFGFMVLLIYQIAAFKLSKKYREKLEEQLEKKAIKDSLDVLLPRTNREKRWWSIVSATAGIGEEIFYRGFLLYLLINILPNISIYFILIASGIIFGLAHCYQGFGGMLKTGSMGLMFSALYIITGSLIISILLHFVIDFSANFLFYEQQKT